MISFIGPYKTVRKIGQGGFAKVYECIDEVSGGRVAVKLLAPRNEDDSGYLNFRSFDVEINSLAKLKHPNIISILDSGFVPQQGFYVAMELVRGKPFNPYLQDKKRSIRLLLQVARALAYMHDLGVVHRDIKPNNILVSDEGDVRVSDFGIAKIEEQSRTLAELAHSLGSIGFVSPEQARLSPEVDGRADIYSLGIVVFCVAVGRHPFEKDVHEQEALACIVGGYMPDPIELNKDADPGLCQIIRKCIAFEPIERYQKAEQVVQDLEMWLDDRLALDPVVIREKSVEQVRTNGGRWQSTVFSVFVFLVLLAVSNLLVFWLNRDAAPIEIPGTGSEIVEIQTDPPNCHVRAYRIDESGEPVIDSEVELGVSPCRYKMDPGFYYFVVEGKQEFTEVVRRVPTKKEIPTSWNVGKFERQEFGILLAEIQVRSPKFIKPVSINGFQIDRTEFKVGQYNLDHALNVAESRGGIIPSLGNLVAAHETGQISDEIGIWEWTLTSSGLADSGTDYLKMQFALFDDDTNRYSNRFAFEEDSSFRLFRRNKPLKK